MTNETIEKYEENLQDHNRYETIFRNSAVAIMLTDADEKIIDWNDYTEQMLAMNRSDLYLKPVKELYSEDEWSKIRSENIREKGMQHHLETKILRKDSSPLDVDISLSVLKNPDGQITGSIGVIKDISKQKQAEQRLNSLIENTEDSIYLVDKNKTYQLVNQELLKRLKRSENELIGHQFQEYHTHEETQSFNQHIEWVFEHGETCKEEHRSISLGQWFLRSFSPIKDSITGETLAVVVVSKDITDMKKTEYELQESEQKYKTIFENSAVAIMKTNEKEQIIDWNGYTEQMLGISKKDLYLKPVKELYSEDEWSKIRSENIREKGMQHHLETKILRKDSSPLDVDISISVLKDTEGQITGSIGVIKDISEQKKAQGKMIYEHSLLQSLLDTTPDSIYFKDQENKFILVNQAKARHHNMNPDDMIGKTDFDYMVQGQAQKAHEDDNAVMKTEKPIIDKVEKIVSKDGYEKWVSVTKIPRYNNQGNIIGTMGVSRDVTKRIKGQKETEKYKKVAIGQNMRMVELRDKVKDLISEIENDGK